MNTSKINRLLLEHVVDAAGYSTLFVESDIEGTDEQAGRITLKRS